MNYMRGDMVVLCEWNVKIQSESMGVWRGGDGSEFWLWVIRLSRLVCGWELKIGNICKIGVCIKFKTHYMILCFKFVYKNNIIYNDKIKNKIKN